MLYEGGSDMQNSEDYQEPSDDMPPIQRLSLTDPKKIITGADINDLRELLESTWTTKINPDNQNKLKSIQQKNVELQNKCQKW